MIAASRPAAIPPDDLNRLFPLGRPNPLKPKSYEFALVLAGTVSAGAYTAGVLDYMIEALDAWTRAKQGGSPNAPTHDAILSTITGASGGAINGAILVRAASYAFPHGHVAGNPFYDIWVNGVVLADLLQPDTSTGPLRSVFNTDKFERLATDLVTKPGPPLGSDGKSPAARGYLADPLRLFTMVANVTGIPYRIEFRGQSRLGHDLIGHADFLRFGLTVPGGAEKEKGDRPDEFPLSFASPLNWDLVAQSALATSAFPAAFPSRGLKRAMAILGYRVAVVPGEDQNTAEVAQLIPTWDLLEEDGSAPGIVRSVNVDGGTVNNEPLDLARTALAGYNGRNKRDGAVADRGVVLVDPFADHESISPFDPPDFLGLLGPLVSTLVKQARFKPEDIALATDYDTYSRFLVAPVGVAGGATRISGARAIAAGGLGGFLGFLDRKFLDYDFRLGRRNAYEFLTNEFVLPSDNGIFKGTWTSSQMRDHKRPEDHPGPGRPDFYLPIVPLMPELKNNPPPDPTHQDWPRLNGAPSELPNQTRARLDSVFSALKTDLQKRGIRLNWLAGLTINQAWNLYLRGTLQDKFVSTFTQSLNDQDLLPVTVFTWPRTPARQSSAKAAQRNWLAAGAVSSDLTEESDRLVLTTKWRA